MTDFGNWDQYNSKIPGLGWTSISLRPFLPLWIYSPMTAIHQSGFVREHCLSYFVAIDSALSFSADITSGVSRGTVLAPIFYSLHMLHLVTSWINGKQHRVQSVPHALAAQAMAAHLWVTVSEATAGVFCLLSKWLLSKQTHISLLYSVHCGCQDVECSQMWELHSIGFYFSVLYLMSAFRR